MKVMKSVGDFHSIGDLVLEEKNNFTEMNSHQFPFDADYRVLESDPSTDFIETLFASGEEDDPETSSPSSDNSVQLPETPISPTEDFEQKKDHVRTHPLLPCIFQFVASFKQTTTTSSRLQHPLYYNSTTVFPLQELISPELLAVHLDPDQQMPFLQKFERIEQRYIQEQAQLSQTCYDHIAVMFNLLKTQSLIRLVLDEEVESKIQGTIHNPSPLTD